MINHFVRDHDTDVAFGKLAKIVKYMGSETPKELRNLSYERLR